MSPRNLPLRAAIRAGLAASAAGLTLVATPAAALIQDDIGDFAPTYVGAQVDELDIHEAEAVYHLGLRGFGVVSLHSVANPGGAADITPIYVWGIDRGAGQERLVDGSPSVGQGIFFDALIVLSVDPFDVVTGSVTTFGPGGAVTTSLDDIFAFDNVVGAFVPQELLPTTGFAFTDYRFNLWTRDASGNDHIADFALEGGMFDVLDLKARAVPEPATWALMIAGFGMAGATLRRRRGLAAT